ncbi:MAG: cyclase/dehydrase [Betaproteobacteria bacterium]|nr:cyclase/dehydrase [Betaproteobacteria bacterium]
MSLNLPRFAALALAACLMASATHAAEQSHTLLIEDISVHRLESGLEVNVAYQVPISLCKAFAFLTHYEGATDMPGVLESRVLSREGNKVQVKRLVEERILFFPLKIHSVVEYSEFPNHGLDFHQISGNLKRYVGSWRLIDDGLVVHFRYQSLIEPDTLIPNVVMRHFIEHSMRKRFERMSENAYRFGQTQTAESKCVTNHQ